MNKKSRKRAFLVYVILCLIYVSVAFRLTDKMTMRRISGEQADPSQSAFLPVPKAEQDRNAPPPQWALSPVTASSVSAESDGAAKGQAVNNVRPPLADGRYTDVGRPGIEPSLLISVPVVCHAIRQGWIEKEGLIFGKKDAYNNGAWKKPLEIIKDRDEDGLRSIFSTIGQKRVLEFLKKEGVNPSGGLSPEDIVLGRGYAIDPDMLISLYNRNVGPECDEAFPFSLAHTGVAKGKNGFEMTKGEEGVREARKTAETEWMMPNLASLPIRTAIDKLSVHTARIKVFGSGYVTDQSPRPFERLKGEQECIIRGRTEN